MLQFLVKELFHSNTLAYGQTGSGKTYTMQGPAYERGMSWKNNSENWGIAPRLVRQYDN
jgi:hypothetical protein